MTAAQQLHHFEDLSPEVFEQLIYELVKRSGEFDEVQWYGGPRDKGRDVVAYKHTAAGREKWYIQAKRYQRIKFSTLEVELDKVAEHTRSEPDFAPHAIVFAIACDIAPHIRDQVTAHAQDLNLPEPYFWDRLALSEKLEAYPDIEEKFIGAPISERRVVKKTHIALAVATAVVVAVMLGLFIVLRLKPPPPMTGVFNIAVAGFSENCSIGRPKTGPIVAGVIEGQLREAFSEWAPGFTVDIRGPDQVGTIKGRNEVARARSAQRIAETIGADIVVYGHVERDAEVSQVIPEFYIKEESFYEAQEIVGPHALGTPLEISSRVGIKDKNTLGEKGKARVEALSWITIGLVYYSDHQYERALEHLRAAEGVVGWADEEGKEVLFILTGNALGKIAARKIRDAGENEVISRQNEIAEAMRDLAEAETYYRRCLQLDAEYARAYIGLADILYFQALRSWADDPDGLAIDVAGLGLAAQRYQDALTARNQPPLADVPAKVHFGLGQCYVMQVYWKVAGLNCDAARTVLEAEIDDEAAKAELEAVVKAYGDGRNPRLQERAGEAHARLGLLYSLSCNIDPAIKEYETAVSLLAVVSAERAEHYNGVIQRLKATE